MAAKRSGASDKYFSFPKFDREAFLAKEVRDAKVSFISLGLAALLALVSLMLAAWVIVGLGILLGFAGPFSLRWLLPKAGIDTSEFERKNWIGPGIITFFAWLGLFILLSNPPFQDLAHPQITAFAPYQLNATGDWELQEEVAGEFQLDQADTLLVVKIVDNWRVEDPKLELRRGEVPRDSWPLQVLKRDAAWGNATYNISISDKLEGNLYFVLVTQTDLERFADSDGVWVTATDPRDNRFAREWPIDITVPQ